MTTRSIKAGEAAVEIGADPKMQPGLEKGRQQIRRWVDSVKQTTGLTAVFDPARMGLEAFQAAMRVSVELAKQLTAAITSTAAEMDRIGKLADRVNVSTESLLGFERGAEQSGLSAGELTGALQTMSKRIGEAAMGSGEAKSALEALGIEIQSLARLPGESQLEVIADKLNEVETNGGKAALAMKIFGDAGKGALLTFLAQGSEGLRQLSADTATFSRESAASAEAFNNSMDDLARTADRLKIALTEGAIGPLAELTAELEANVEAMKALDEAARGVGLSVGAVAAASSGGLQNAAQGSAGPGGNFGAGVRSALFAPLGGLRALGQIGADERQRSRDLDELLRIGNLNRARVSTAVDEAAVADIAGGPQFGLGGGRIAGLGGTPTRETQAAAASFLRDLLRSASDGAGSATFGASPETIEARSVRAAEKARDIANEQLGIELRQEAIQERQARELTEIAATLRLAPMIQVLP